MTYLVTGGAGFIGANYIKYLLKIYGKNVNIIILDALTYAGNLLTIKDEIQLDNVTFIRGDIGDNNLVTKILTDNDVDYIVNFAAESHVDRSITNPKLFLETNILGTHNMLECARQVWFIGKDDKNKCQYKTGKKFLQISTDEVYGSLEKDFSVAKNLIVSDKLKEVIGNRTDMKTFGNEYFTENTPLSPRSPYSSSKTSADLIANAYFHTYDFPVNITRCSNNYGPYHFPEKLIPLIIKNILAGKWNIDRFAFANGEADVQPSLLPRYFSIPLLGCQELFSKNIWFFLYGNILCQLWVGLFQFPYNCPRRSGKGRQNLHGHTVFPGQFHTPVMKHLGSVFNEGQHFFIADPAEPDRIGKNPWIPVVYSIHIRKNLASVRL